MNSARSDVPHLIIIVTTDMLFIFINDINAYADNDTLYADGLVNGNSLNLSCNKLLRIYQTNHLNLTMKCTVCVANCYKHRFYLIFTLKCLA